MEQPKQWQNDKKDYNWLEASVDRPEGVKGASKSKINFLKRVSLQRNFKDRL